MLDVVRKSSFNPNTNKYYAYSPAWAPDPGDYRKSMWEKVGLPNGPTTWDELLTGGAEIKKSQGVQMGIGMSQEIDSNMAGRALLWSFGGSIQDENEKVVINSPETVAAVEFMTRLYKESMTPRCSPGMPHPTTRAWLPVRCRTSSIPFRRGVRHRARTRRWPTTSPSSRR